MKANVNYIHLKRVPESTWLCSAGWTESIILIVIMFNQNSYLVYILKPVAFEKCIGCKNEKLGKLYSWNTIS